MAYSISAITSVTDIPALVKSFADSLGFVTSGTDVVSVRHPTYAGAKDFVLSSSLAGTAATRREQIRLSVSGLSAETPAIVESPKLNPTAVNNANAVVVVQPTALHLFGNLEGNAADAGRSWIAGVIEYGFNLYRHFYLGYVEKITDYSGGEVITGSAQTPVGWSTSVVRGDHTGFNAYPFSMKNLWGAVSGGGGLHIDHPGNPVPWRTFYAPVTNLNIDPAFASIGNSCVLGGYGDSINSGLMGAGKSPYSGAQILTPINLYIGKRIGETQFFQAIGAPSGVRLVHMEDLDPGAQVQVGASVWMVFPVFSKNTSLSLGSTNPLSASTAFPTHNSSQYIGQAYLVSE